MFTRFMNKRKSSRDVVFTGVLLAKTPKKCDKKKNAKEYKSD
jgi:hypothetical protein